MPTYTPNHGLTRPIPFDTSDVDVWGIQVNESLDIIDVRMVRSGLLADRPAAGTVGRKYVATDDTPPTLYVDVGTQWVATGAAQALSSHTADTGNPHSVTAAQVGAPTTATFDAHTANASAHHARPTAGTHLTESATGAFDVTGTATHGSGAHDATVPTQAALDAHTTNVSNPHSVTAAQVGAPTTADLNAHLGDTSNPHSVTKAQLGVNDLSNVRDASNFTGANGGAMIQAAINDLPAEGGSVYVPPQGPDLGGRWDVVDAIKPKNNVHLWGIPGATRLFLANGANDDIIRLADAQLDPPVENVTIEGFVMDGNKANNTKVPDINGRNGACIYVFRSEDLTIRNVRGGNMNGYLVQIKGSTNALVERCWADGCTDDGLSTTDIGYDTQLTKNVTFRSCVATNNADTGMEVDDGPQHVRFEDCYSIGNTDGFVMHVHDPVNRPNPGGPTNVVWENCTANNNTETGFVLGANNTDSPNLRDYQFKNIVARNNSVEAFNLDKANGSTVPIRDVIVDGFYFEHNVAGNSSAVDLQHGNTARRITLKNGTIRATTGGGGNGIRANTGTLSNVNIENVNVEVLGGVYYGILASTPTGAPKDGVRIANCTVTGCQRAGIIAWATATMENYQIVNNECWGNGTDTLQDAPRRSGISIENSGLPMARSLVSGNICHDNGGHGIYRNGGDYNIYTNNILRGNTASSFGGTLEVTSVETANIT